MENTIVIGLYEGRMYGPYRPEQLAIREQSSTVYLDTLYIMAADKLPILEKICQLGSWKDYLKFVSKHLKML